MTAFTSTILRLFVISSITPLLTGCPLSDDYFIDPNYGAKSMGGQSGAGAPATGGSGALGGAGGSAGTTNSTFAVCSGTCSGTCCNDLCTDVTSDPSNCGTCGTTCPDGQACVNSACTKGWAPMATSPLSAREKAAYVVMGDRLFIFGGADSADNSLNDGAIYDPKANRWTTISIDANVPSPRRLATAVWTGSTVVVFGGRNDTTSAGYTDAAVYDPAADSWLTMPNDSNGRVGPVGVSSSLFTAFWGGWGAYSAVLSGAERFDWSSSRWASATSLAYAEPGVLDNTAWAFTGQYLYLYGGRVNSTTKTNAAYSYNLQTNSWTSLGATTLGPSSRWGAFGVWDGASFYVWAGRDENAAKGDGAAFSAGSWKAIALAGAAVSARWAPSRQAGWAFARGTGDLLFIGGEDALGNFQTDGGHYVESAAGSGTWTNIPSWPSKENHQWGVAAYVGGAVLVWGGHNGMAATATGERWAP